MWVQFYSLMKVTISQGAAGDDPANLANSFTILGLLSDNQVDFESASQQILDTINALSQNPSPLAMDFNRTILSNEVEMFVLCDCIEGEYRAGEDCLDCPKGCVNCSLEESLLWDRTVIFWVSSTEAVSLSGVTGMPIFDDMTNSNL